MFIKRCVPKRGPGPPPGHRRSRRVLAMAATGSMMLWFVPGPVAQAATRSLSVNVAAVVKAPTPLTVVTATLKAANVGKRYYAELKAKGGKAPYTWHLASGQLPLGLSLSPRGVLTGKPTTPGPATLALVVADSERPTPQTINASLTLTIVAARLKIKTGSLPRGEATSLYNATLNAVGGTPPYAWSQLTGKLPPGITLSPTGTLSGTPTAGGPFAFTAEVTDAGLPAQVAKAHFSINVTETPLKDKTRSLPGATTNAAYSVTFVVSGGIAPYTWSMASGQLPAGIILSTAGVLAGTSATAGNYSFHVRITDSSSVPESLTVPYRLVVAAVPLSITTDKLPGAEIGSVYGATLVATGGTAPYAWNLASGKLPPGVTVSTAGTLTGTPTQSGSFHLSIKVTDSSPKPLSMTSHYKLVVEAIPLLVATTALPGAAVGSPYVASLQATGGTAPFTWHLATGPLPPGVTMTSAGNLSGLPKTAGTYTIVVKVTDKSPEPQTATAALTLVVGLNDLNLNLNVDKWSGYVRTGLFTSVTGTFTVPTITLGQDNLTPSGVSEWVGVDGVTSSDYIRAGVSEVDPATGESYCSGGSICIYPWWQSSSGSGVTPIVLTVSAGDSITVTIWQLSGSSWAITLDDNTTGQNFRAAQTYQGHGGAIEYVVDSPSAVSTLSSAVQGTESIAALGNYSPSVQFTNLHTLGSAKSTAAVELVQNGVQVSTPSVFTNAGFTLAYGSIAPPPPS